MLIQLVVDVRHPKMGHRQMGDASPLRPRGYRIYPDT